MDAKIEIACIIHTVLCLELWASFFGLWFDLCLPLLLFCELDLDLRLYDL